MAINSLAQSTVVLQWVLIINKNQHWDQLFITIL